MVTIDSKFARQTAEPDDAHIPLLEVAIGDIMLFPGGADNQPIFRGLLQKPSVPNMGLDVTKGDDIHIIVKVYQWRFYYETICTVLADARAYQIHQGARWRVCSRHERQHDRHWRRKALKGKRRKQ